MLRTHTCGELGREHTGSEVTLCGWVHRIRDMGGVFFLDLRDRYGLVQLKVSPESREAHEYAQGLRRETVIRASGRVESRPPEMVNQKLETGEVEIEVGGLEILAESDTPPFVIEYDHEHEAEPAEELRLKYRYLDLRRKKMLERMTMRHRAAQAARRVLEEREFLEIETSLFVRSTPEGSRDFLVPSRTYPGEFYALPQSPQIYKQILQVGGVDRYFQFARCFRDEDPRGGRQLIHTQIDLEMSFVEEEDVFAVVESVMAGVGEALTGKPVATPFERMTYEECVRRFGIDKPDLRFGMELSEVTDLFSESDFVPFRRAADEGGSVVLLALPGGVQSTSRKKQDALSEWVGTFGLQGLYFAKVTAEGLATGFAKGVGEAQLSPILERTGASEGDLLIAAAGPTGKVRKGLGNLRHHLGDQLGLRDSDLHRFLFVTDFPLFEFDEESQAWQAMHHIFTMPRDEDIDKIDSDPGAVIGRLYDIVMNGVELGSGSIRCHRRDLQLRLLERIGMDEATAIERFGFLLESYRYGAPPHGGIAIGFDNLVMTFLGERNIRDVIAFPNAGSGRMLMDDCPSPVESDQLEELHVRLERRCRED